MVWPKCRMLTMTVKHFLVAMTKGGICCLKSFIIRQMISCPKALRTEKRNKSFWSSECSNMNVKMQKSCCPIVAQPRAIRHVYLLMEQYMSITPGLNSALISAWKSGRSPSPMSEMSRRPLPSQPTGLLLLVDSVYLKQLKRNIPTATSTPMTILPFPSLRFLSLTFEQNKATKMTERRLQLFIMTTAGKDATCTALLQVSMLMFIMALHMTAFLAGIYTGACPCCRLINSLIAQPNRVQMRGGKNVNTIDASKLAVV